MELYNVISFCDMYRHSYFNETIRHGNLHCRRNAGGRKKWMQRTPAMAEGLTDHVWTIRELMDVTTM
jgi:hypothetical protein